MEIYHFVTNWLFPAPIESVWEELVDLKSWPSWWPSYRKAKFHGSESKLQLGSLVDNEVRGKLPFSLCFTTEIILLQPPQLLELKSSGDLGNGKFVLEQRNDGTAVTYYWDVGTSKPVFNLLEKLPFVRAMMEKNHDFVMDEGFRGLKQKLGR